MPDSIILLFIKAPQMGRIKTRLAAVIGDKAALEIYKSFIYDILDMLKSTGYPFRLCVYPPHAEAAVKNWLGDQYQYMPQNGSDLGDRMENAFSSIFTEGFSRAVLIGSDIPDLTESVIRDAFAALELNDTVLGPAADGGYYLIGFNQRGFLPEVFHEISWSTDTVFMNSMNILRKALRSIYLVPEWQDVDSADDLRALFARNEHSEFRRSRTMEYLNRHKMLLFSGERE